MDIRIGIGIVILITNDIHFQFNEHLPSCKNIVEKSYDMYVKMKLFYLFDFVWWNGNKISKTALKKQIGLKKASNEG